MVVMTLMRINDVLPLLMRKNRVKLSVEKDYLETAVLRELVSKILKTYHILHHFGIQDTF